MHEILFSELLGNYGAIGLIKLNRPQALNAMTLSMYKAMAAKLKEWQQASHIKTVVIQGEGDKAFCAGGDVRSLYLHKDKPIAQLMEFFWHEYRFNHQLFHYTKPYIALMDGITMGGGVGISIYGSHRVGTERLKWAMPETTIGFFPDVGGSYFLSRFPFKLGWYLGLSGQAIDVHDGFYVGAVDNQIKSSEVSAFINALTHVKWLDNAYETVDHLLQEFRVEPAESKLMQHCEMIEESFNENTIENILNNLTKMKAEWVQPLIDSLHSKSPMSLKIVIEQLTRGERLNFDECLQMEYRLAGHFLQGPNFYEGVRAALVDKDRKPNWQPAHLAEVTSALVEKYFSPLSGELSELNFN